MISEIYERLLGNCGAGREDAAILIEATVQPAGPDGTKVAPPSYPVGERAEHPYLVEKRRIDGEVRELVLLDSYQSQANRCEEALLWARDDGRFDLPLFELTTTVDTPAGEREFRLTSLDFPHRYADAYLRDSELDGVRFDNTEIGRRLRLATPADATVLYEREPCSLVYGAWDSHRKGRQAKFARIYHSTVVGLDPVVGQRRGGRLDPANLTGTVSGTVDDGWEFVGDGEKRKGNRLSEIGHGNALDSGEAHGWVTVSECRRWAEVSLAGLERIRFAGATVEQSAAARAALAALALLGDRLAFDRPSWFFRSGCDLARRSEELAWELPDGQHDRFQLDQDAALELFRHAVDRAAAAGISMASDTIELTPIKGLQDAIENAYVAAEAGE